MIELFISWISVCFRTVVGGKNHDSVGIQSGFSESVEDLSTRVIGLHHEIPVGSGFRFTVELVIRNDGRVRRWQRKIKEKRLGFPFARMDIFHAFFGKSRQDLIEIPIRHTRAFAAFPVSLFGVLWGFRKRDVRHTQKAIIFNPDVRRKIDHVVAEVVIESMIQRAATKRLRPIEILMALRFFIGSRKTNRIPVPTQMPLADAGGDVTLFSQHLL